MFYTEIDVKKISFHPKLVKSDTSILNALKAVFGGKPVELCFFLPPVFLKQGDAFELIGRHYSYELLINNSSAKKIPALIVSEATINDFVSMDGQLIKMIIEIAEKMRKIGSVAQSRKKLKESCMTCPFCGAILQGPQYGRPESSGPNKGFYRITCYKKTDKKKPCSFNAYLSKEEYSLFEEREYPTETWLKRTDQTCNDCGKPLFWRKRFEKERLFCEDIFRKDGVCKSKRLRA